jgi:threonine/homoserine/homoserine lactone efflux protein
MSSQVVLTPGIWRPVMSLILTSMVIMGSPGPSTISATAVGAAFGVRRSLRYVGGLIVGTTAVLLLVSIGVVALVLSIPQAARVLGAIATVYVLYLAFRIGTAAPLAIQSHEVEAPAFAGGFLLAIANPKAFLAIAAVFADTTVIAANGGWDAMVKAALLSVMIVVIHLCWLAAGASLSRILHDPVGSRLVNVALAVILVTVTFAALVS